MISEIFVDMDGVLSNFHKKFDELYHAKPEIDYPSNNKKKAEYVKRFQEFIATGQFANLDPMPDIELALDFLRTVHKQVPVCILTSTAREEYLDELSRQKRIWLREHDIEFHPVFVPGKRYKYYYSKPGRVLIDDTVSNIEEWRSMGGIGILHKSWQQTIAEYKEYEESLRRNES